MYRYCAGLISAVICCCYFSCATKQKTKKVNVQHLLKSWRMAELVIGNEYQPINPFMSITFTEQGKWITNEKGKTQEGRWEIDEYKGTLTLQNQQVSTILHLSDSLLVLKTKATNGQEVRISYVPDHEKDYDFWRKKIRKR
ncbi:MAG: hypothetical protein NZ519_12170 [Bacteroidia bacterium]|nr:hypothetical protein [Bacteroidia bacterium]MDW8302764.1 hypothetical protein [Bacteroidia bacterium]